MHNETMHLEDIPREATAIAISSKAAITGGFGGGMIAWFMSVNWLAVSGIGIGAVGLLTNIYFQWRRDQREEKESSSRLDLEELQRAEAKAKTAAIKEGRL